MKVHLRRDVLPNVRPATPDDYARWLRGYTSKIRGCLYYVDGPMPPMYVALRGFVLKPLLGADSVDLIVPAGMTVTCAPGWSHNRLYYLDGFRLVGGGGVAMFRDTIPNASHDANDTSCTDH